LILLLVEATSRLEIDDEIGTLALLTLHVDGASIGDYDILANAQAQPHSLLVGLLCLAQFTEVRKQFLLVFKRNSTARVSEGHLEADYLFLVDWRHRVYTFIKLLFVRCRVFRIIELRLFFLLVCNLFYFEVDRDRSTNGCELDPIREEVQDYLAIATLVTKDLLEVVLVEGVDHNGPQQANLLEVTLRRHRLEALLYQFGAVEILVHHCEGVVVELGLVHQVSHQGRHHFDLPLHVLELLPYVDLLFEVTLDGFN
jgi:hypothetical protein